MYTCCKSNGDPARGQFPGYVWLAEMQPICSSVGVFVKKINLPAIFKGY
jgi:hypothetical protein